MFRFTIRDVLWLTALVAMGVAWRLDRTSLDASRVATRDHAIKLQTSLANDKKNQERERLFWDTPAVKRTYTKAFPEPVDWQLAEQPIPE